MGDSIFVVLDWKKTWVVSFLIMHNIIEMYYTRLSLIRGIYIKNKSETRDSFTFKTGLVQAGILRIDISILSFLLSLSSVA